MDDDARAGYDAPFPDESYKAAARAMPGLVPDRPDDPASEANRAAWAVLAASPRRRSSRSPTATRSPAAMGPILQRVLPGARGRAHPTIENAGHFLQEDAGPELAAAIVAFVEATPVLS